MFDDVTPRLGLPYVVAAQAQKHIPINESLARLDGRPQWISHEGSAGGAKRYLEATGVKAAFTFADLPYPNHTAAWVLRDLPIRARLRAWLAEVLR